MSLSELESTAALVVVDLQRGVVSSLPTSDVVANSAALARAFRDAGRPVVLVTADGTPPGRTDAARGVAPRPAREPDFAVVADELDAQPEDIRVVKRAWGAFLGTELHDRLRERGVTQVVLTGVATSIGVESTARGAHDLGYHVVLVADAMTDRAEQAHDHTLRTIFPRLGEVSTTADVLAALG